MDKIKVISKSREERARPKVPKLRLDSLKATTAAGSRLPSCSNRSNKSKGLVFLENINKSKEYKRSPRQKLIK